MLQCFWEAFSHLFPHFLMVQPYPKNSFKSRFSSKSQMLFVLLHRNITHVSVSIHTSLAWNPKIELRCIPLVILQMFLQLHWTPSVVNSVDWTWFGKAHTPVYIRSHVDGACQSTSQAWSQRNRLQISQTGLSGGADRGKGTETFLLL